MSFSFISTRLGEIAIGKASHKIKLASIIL